MRLMIVCCVLFAGGLMLQPYSTVGTAVSGGEIAVMWGGCAKTGNEATVCYNGGAGEEGAIGGCAAGTCGCTKAQKILNDPSGKKPDDASPCGTSACSTPMGLTNTGCGGG